MFQPTNRQDQPCAPDEVRPCDAQRRLHKFKFTVTASRRGESVARNKNNNIAYVIINNYVI